MTSRNYILFGIVISLATIVAPEVYANWNKVVTWPSVDQKWHEPLDIAQYKTDESAFYEAPSYPAINGGNTRGHAGLDIKAPAGSPVRAIAPGNIQAIVNNGKASESYVIVLHRTDARYNNRFCAIYGHVSSELSAVDGQDGVQKGDVIGTIMSGSNLPFYWTDHLHFGINVEKDSPMCWGKSKFVNDKNIKGRLGWGRGALNPDYNTDGFKSDYDAHGFRDPIKFLSENKSRY